MDPALISASRCQLDWSGVYCAAATQFTADGTLDLDATWHFYDWLIESGVHGLIVLTGMGEGDRLSLDEKLAVLDGARAVAADRVPVVAAVSESTTSAAVALAGAASRLAIDGLIVAPAFGYPASNAEIAAHVCRIGASSPLPIVIDCSFDHAIPAVMEVLEQIGALPSFAAVKVDGTREVNEIHYHFGSRFAVLAGCDSVALESILVGACGWVSTIANAFPNEARCLFEHAAWGELSEALEQAQKLLPLLQLDSSHDCVQAIKLVSTITGGGREHVRMPRLPLAGERRARVLGAARSALMQIIPAVPSRGTAAR